MQWQMQTSRMTIEFYELNFGPNEEGLGLHDIKVEGYGEDAEKGIEVKGI